MKAGQSQNIVEEHRRLRTETDSAWPDFLIAFNNNGLGDQTCFDTRSTTEKGEYPIVSWEHELSAEENLEQLEELGSSWDSFADWLIEETESADELD